MARRGQYLSVVFSVAAFAAGCGEAMPPRSLNIDAVSALAANKCGTPPPALTRFKALASKSPVEGLLDLGQVSGAGLPVPTLNSIYYACTVTPAMGGLVVNDAWADVQPNGPASFNTSTIDAALAQVASYNKLGHPIGVRLRVWAGINAPQWAKAIVGSPIPICDPYGGVPTPAPSPTPTSSAGTTPSPSPSPSPCPSAGSKTDVRTIGAYWTGKYQQAWANLQRRLAAKYDANPLVSEISVTTCSTITDEPYIHSIDAWTLQNLQKAGFSIPAYKQCLEKELAGYGAWHATIVDDIFNPMYYNAKNWDVGFTEAMMRQCVSSLHSRCLLDNQELGKYGATPAPGASPNVTALFTMWSYMGSLRKQGALVSFQTAAPSHLYQAGGNHNLVGWNIAVQLAQRYGADSLELWPPSGVDAATKPCTTASQPWVKGYTCFGRTALTQWSHAIVNARVATSERPRRGDAVLP